jgi:hypothetical protein
MKLIILRIYRFLLSIKSIFIINVYIGCKKIFNKDFKIIFFYFPVRSYQDNILELIDEIKKEKNLEVILAYNSSSSKEVENYNKDFFLNLGYLKYINNVNIFISSYVVYDFPNSLHKIYINHDIYDAPMVEVKIENNLIKALNKCDYIFLSSDIAITNFQKKIDISSDNENKKLLLVNTGYLKLDHVHKKISNVDVIEDSILLAPTLSSMFTNYNLSGSLIDLIKKILDNTKFKLIYRPHPGDIGNHKQNIIINNIYKMFEKNKNFTLDTNASYLESYKKSRMLITDFSGTAYTYAFSKLRPVIFFSKNEINLTKSNFNDLFFFKDRLDIGTIVENIDNLNNEIYSVDKQIEFFSNKIKLLRAKRIKFFNSSIEQNLLNIKKILKIESQ